MVLYLTSIIIDPIICAVKEIALKIIFIDRRGGHELHKNIFVPDKLCFCEDAPVQACNQASIGVLLLSNLRLSVLFIMGS